MQISETTLNKIATISLLNNYGGNIFDYFTDKSITKVNVMLTTPLCAVLAANAQAAGITIANYFLGEDSDFSTAELANLIYLFNANIKPVPYEENAENKDIPLITFGWHKPVKKQYYNLDSLIDYSYAKCTLIDKVLSRMETNPNLNVIFLITPTLHKVANKNENERYIVENKNWHYTKNAREELQKAGKSEEYISDVMNSLSIKADNAVLKDYTTPHCNVISGHRLTLNTPSKYDHTIYFFGHSICFGRHVDDKNTMQTHLMDELNDYFENNSLFTILNCANCSSNNYKRIGESFEYHQPQNNDICIIVASYNNLVYENYGDKLTFWKPQEEVGLFNRPHNYGESIFVDVCHFTEEGNFAIGKYLVKKLIDEKLLERNGVATLRHAPPRSATLRHAPPRSATLRHAPPRSACGDVGVDC